MNCVRFKRLIRPYLKSEVEGVLGNEFRWHKHFCDACRAEFAATPPAAEGRWKTSSTEQPAGTTAEGANPSRARRGRGLRSHGGPKH